MTHARARKRNQNNLYLHPIDHGNESYCYDFPSPKDKKYSLLHKIPLSVTHGEFVKWKNEEEGEEEKERNHDLYGCKLKATEIMGKICTN